MADIIDKANDHAQYLLDCALANVKQPRAVTGFCFNCSDPLMPGERYCDEYCEEDYMKRERNK